MIPINRGVVIVRPKEPFVKWLNALPDTDEAVTLEEVRREPNAYLIPSDVDEQGLKDTIYDMAKDVFAFEIWSWCQDEKAVPPDLTAEMFYDWFDFEACSMAIDVYDEPLRHEG